MKANQAWAEEHAGQKVEFLREGPHDSAEHGNCGVVVGWTDDEAEAIIVEPENGGWYYGKPSRGDRLVVARQPARGWYTEIERLRLL